MTTEKEVPALRAVASAGRVHFGIQTYPWSELESTVLSYEATPDQARKIARGLIEAATYAEGMAAAFPLLAPLDDTRAIEAPTRSEAVEEEHEGVPTTGHEDDEPFDPESRVQDS